MPSTNKLLKNRESRELAMASTERGTSVVLARGRHTRDSGIFAPVTNAESYLIFAKSFARCANDKSNFKSYYGADNKFAQ
jgi:hypothetical protein